MNRSNRVIVFLLVVVMLCGCAAKKLVKKAFEYETAGLKSDALELYCRALEKDEDNIDAKLGAKRLGQEQLNERLEIFKGAYSKGDNTMAVSYFQTAQALYNKVRNHGVELDFPDHYRTYYNEAKSAYIEEKYYKACQLLDAEKFSEAETILREVLSYSATYKDARDKLREAVCEPLYRRGVAQFGDQKYKESYDTFNSIISQYHTYKDALTLRDEAKEAYVDAQYALGCRHMEAENFRDAENAFRNVLAYSPSYKDANDRLLVSIWEPKYRSIANLMQGRRYRSAYMLCSETRSQYGDYKNSAELAAECFERATVIMVVHDISNSADPAFAKFFKAELVRNIQSLNNQFLKITDHRPITKTLSKVVVLDCNFQTFKYIDGNLKYYKQKGWLYVTKKNIFGEVYHEYEKVEYDEYEKSCSLDFMVRHRITDNTGRSILKEGANSYKSSDYVNYAYYNGDTRNLYPGYWKNKGIVGFFNKDEDFIDHAHYSQLQQKLQARRTVKTYDSMCQEVAEPAITNIVNAVSEFMQYE